MFFTYYDRVLVLWTKLFVENSLRGENFLITTDRPDIVIIDRMMQNLNVFEFTVPYEHNVEARNTDKNNIYSYVKTDITKYKANIEPLEIWARGYIFYYAQEYLLILHTRCVLERIWTKLCHTDNQRQLLYLST